MEKIGKMEGSAVSRFEGSEFWEKAMEPKLTANPLNRLNNHTEDKEIHKQNKELGIFFIESCSYFLAPIMDRFSPQKSL